MKQKMLLQKLLLIAGLLFVFGAGCASIAPTPLSGDNPCAYDAYGGGYNVDDAVDNDWFYDYYDYYDYDLVDCYPGGYYDDGIYDDNWFYDYYDYYDYY